MNFITWLRRCKLFHNCYTAFSCATIGETGRLPNDWVVAGNSGKGQYRFERVCLDCGAREYHARGAWIGFELPETENA